MVVLGDSIAEGVGAISSGDGSDGLAYGGAMPVSGVTVYDEQVLQATYPDSGAGTGPDPGYLPHIAASFLTAGFTSVTIYRRATSGIGLATMRGLLHTEFAALHAAGVQPAAVVLAIGTNDANNTSQSAAFDLLLPVVYREIEGIWTRARIIHVEPIAATSAKAEADVVRASIATHVAARSTRSRIAGAGLPGADTVHPSLQTYRDQGLLIGPAYVASG